MSNKIVSYTEARKNLSYIIRDSFLNENIYVVTQRDIPVVVIQKFDSALDKKDPKRNGTKRLKAIEELAGLMKSEIKNPIKYAEKIRKEGWRGK